MPPCPRSWVIEQLEHREYAIGAQAFFKGLDRRMVGNSVARTQAQKTQKTETVQNLKLGLLIGVVEEAVAALAQDTTKCVRPLFWSP